MAILYKKANTKGTTYQTGGKDTADLDKKKKKKKSLIGDKGKDVGGATRLAPGGFGKPYEVSGKALKKLNRKEKKAKRTSK